MIATKWMMTVGFAGLACSRQSTPQAGADQRYQAAYEHVLQSAELARYCRETLRREPSDCPIAIADSTVFISRSLFTSEFLETGRGRPRQLVIDSLVAVDQAGAEGFRPAPVGKLIRTTRDQERPSLGLFFSSIQGNTLIAEVLGRYSPGKHYRELTTFNSGVAFLFLFGDDGRVERVFEKAVNYN
jgi:hypothetical protein